MLYSVKKVHFIGIGGIGMSGIAELLSNKDFIVTGSDLSNSPNVERLRDLGIEIFIGHSNKNITNAELVIYSDAIPDDNIELNAAQSKNLLVYSRAKMISEIAKLNNSTVAIAGTHGKTTTTSMTGSILKSLNLDPTIIVGGVVKSIESNSVLGSGDTFVVEADEYNKSLLHLNPTIAVINNIDFEHIECYKNINELKNTFIDFANSVPFYGTVCLCMDSKNVASIYDKIDKPKFTYGIDSNDVDFRAVEVKHEDGCVSFKVEIDKILYSFRLNIPGKYNVYNALAAIAVSYTMGLDMENVSYALKQFSGVRRRFDIKVDKDVMVVDDYAHHPVEVESVISAVKNNWNRNLYVVFQPHLFSRTKQFYKEFASALMAADKIFITEIFASREKDDRSVSSQLIIDELIKKKHKDVTSLPLIDVVEKLKAKVVKDDIILTLGAGDIWRYSEDLGKHFNE
jgi:UDP-N-acetylmuramate--alanine ligase|tara:strand:- start:16171 stop:17538 length:1368 start_codon:yes stop_codon:yes gene_type:complete